MPSTLLVTGIGELTTHSPQPVDTAGLHAPDESDPAALIVADGRIAWTGRAAAAPAADERVDVEGRAVIPGFVDSHAHLVFAGDRAGEFEARMTGSRYSAGGIRTTVAATRAASDEALRANARRLLAEMARQGTTTVECKTGYGLTVEDEVRALRIAAQECDVATFLGAHVIPAEYADRRQQYVDLVRGPMLEACAEYANFVDVFCERGAFDEVETRLILDAAKARGLAVRLHANQLGHGPGVQLAVEYGAASADHCTYLDASDIDALAASSTVATLLPGVEFSTRSPYPDARGLLNAGARVAIATDCNPGSCYTSSMPFCLALAVREMHMAPAEALRAATLGGAQALGLTDVGHLEVGARADFAVLDAPTYLHLMYRPGVPLIHSVWKNGARIA
ncbi:imidazolonepropionase [Actinospica durhamensis]|uniref:Imidazolonepropionase n=1 Tax=Actinospica durhamensis TaxID=1508375 RepID=A0A941ER40_9ACTN|nr:imidazolonepropionase [Actinospica durhamensis]MBR7834963.1 imidazolonepropionase [Actinospica durhamensis]